MISNGQSADCPLEIIHLPGSPVISITPLSYLPIREINLIGLAIKDLEPLCTMPIEQVRISPETLSNEQFDLLREVNPKHLIGPGDPRVSWTNQVLGVDFPEQIELFIRECFGGDPHLFDWHRTKWFKVFDCKSDQVYFSNGKVRKGGNTDHGRPR